MKRVKTISKFCIIGFLCFLLDFSFSILFFKVLGFPKVFVRFPAWLISVSFSYFLNLNFTFRSAKQKLSKKSEKFKRYSLYISSQAFGGIINISLYTLSILKLNLSILSSILIGTFFGLLFNYIAAKYILQRNYL